MLKSSPCCISWADYPLVKGCSKSRAAPLEKLCQRQQRTTMMHSAPIQTFAPARIRSWSESKSRNRSRSGTRAASSLMCVSRPSGITEGFNSRLSSIDGREFRRSGGVRKSRRTVVGASRDRERGLHREEGLDLTQVLEAVKVGQPGGNRKDNVVEVQIEKLGLNSRKIIAKITIEAPLDNVWAILTDYEHLADFIPGLAVNELLEKRHNGARLYQVGEQNIALGVKFKAKAVVDCEEKPTKVHEGYIRRDIDFDTVEGDFQIFRGTWRMEQPVSKPSSSASPAVRGGGGDAGKGIATILSYILVVQPQIWLPVALVEGRLTSEVKTNLACIRQKTLQPSRR